MRSFGFLTVVAVETAVALTVSRESRDVSIYEDVHARQQAAVIANSDFLRRGLHASAVCGNYVYIDGGDFSYSAGSTINFDYATTILSIDLSSSWTNSTVTIQSTAKPSGVPVLDLGSIWCNETGGNLVTGFAGGQSPLSGAPALPELSLWSFDPDNNGGGSWNEVLSSDNAAWKNLQRPLNGLKAAGGGKGYVLGGYNATNGIPLPGIVSIDLTNLTITNSSAAGYNANGTAELGELHYVPSFGPQGVFVILGGDISPLDTYTPGMNLQSFDKVTIFDPSSGNFYNQSTTGNPPEPRAQFCTAGVASSNGSYEIFVYAGWNTHLGPVAVPYDEVYILTLPAFVWIKVQYAPESPRHDLTCHTVGKRQMLIIGGVDSASTSGSNTLFEDPFNQRDPFTQGLGIFDMTSLTFADNYNADAETYVQSEPVLQTYAGSSNLPASWDSDELEDLFRITHFPNATSTGTNPSTAAHPSSTAAHKPSPKSSTNAGAIAGGVVGGIAAVALVAGGIYFFLRKRRDRRASELDSTDSNYAAAAPSELGGGSSARGKAELGYNPVPMENLHDAKLRPNEVSEMGDESARVELP